MRYSYCCSAHIVQGKDDEQGGCDGVLGEGLYLSCGLKKIIKYNVTLKSILFSKKMEA